MPFKKGNPTVYYIKNLINNKIYVGSSVNLIHRWFCHKQDLKQNKHANAFLQNAWNKYKEEDFEFGILEECAEGLLIEREQYWMDFYKSYDRNKGYNLRPKAASMIGFHHSEESKKKMSELKIGCIPWNKDKKGLYKCSEETKRKIGKKGESNSFSKLKLEEVKSMREEYNNTVVTLQQIAEKYNIALTTTSAIINNKSWKDPNYALQSNICKSERRSQAKLTLQIAEEIRREYKTGEISQEDLAKKYGVARACIQAVLNYRTWKP
jgi:group I intron endonuclease